jgi:hypothetical protein
MHEIGHNLGLRHSNEAGSTYEDKSGMMGHSFLSYESPYMCFNTAKNWQLGWYEDKRTTINPLNDGFWQGQLIGYVDYMNSSVPSSAAVVVKVEGHNFDYFIGFNVKTGINRQNQESAAANKVTVHSVGAPGAESSLVAKLGAGNTFENTRSGKSSLVTPSSDLVHGSGCLLDRSPAFRVLAEKSPDLGSEACNSGSATCWPPWCQYFLNLATSKPIRGPWREVVGRHSETPTLSTTI